MTDRRVYLVTGAGPGSLGEATAAQLRAHGRVITTRRTGTPSADFHPLDLADIDSVTAFSNWLVTSTDRLDVLVNNAGVHLDLRSKWRAPQLVDGYEVHWRTNYLGTAHLTRLLRPLLLRTAKTHGEARVVYVVSQLHERGRNEWLFDHITPYNSWAAYGTSKLALVHEAAELERRYGSRGLHGYSLHPGSVYTRVADRGLETAPVLARLRKLAAPARAADPRVAGGRRGHVGVLRDLARRGAGRLPRPVGHGRPVVGRQGGGSQHPPLGDHQPVGRPAARLLVVVAEPWYERG